MNFLKTIELQYKHLKALSLCKAKSDVRFYLCGIYLGDGFMASTNGHIALIIDEENLNGFDLILPNEAVNSLIRKVGNNPKVKTINLHQLDDEYWVLDHQGSLELFKPIDGKFPDIKHVDIEKPKDIQFKDYPKFNFEYLDIFMKVYKTLGCKGLSPTIYPTTEEKPAYVELDSSSHGLLMPMRL